MSEGAEKFQGHPRMDPLLNTPWNTVYANSISNHSVVCLLNDFLSILTIIKYHMNVWEAKGIYLPVMVKSICLCGLHKKVQDTLQRSNVSKRLDL